MLFQVFPWRARVEIPGLNSGLFLVNPGVQKENPSDSDFFSDLWLWREMGEASISLEGLEREKDPMLTLAGDLE